MSEHRIWWVKSIPRGRVAHATTEPQRGEWWATRTVGSTLCGLDGFYALPESRSAPTCRVCMDRAVRRRLVSTSLLPSERPTPDPKREE